jgi:succinate-semialdehyde dehydrogenase/glutarate-semialdehyde dehydrogenase
LKSKNASYFCKSFINNAKSFMPLSINPLNNEAIASYDEHTPEQIQSILDYSQQAFLSWRETSFDERALRLTAVAQKLRNEKSDMAILMVSEMGKPVLQAEAEVEKCAWVCEYYAEHAEQFLADIPVPTDATKSYVTCRPLGALLAVMPWNFPLWQVFRLAAPALMAGNAVILKHASNVTGCALAIEKLLLESGLPEGVFQTVVTPGTLVGELIKHPVIKGVSLTGSTPAGISIASAAGTSLKKSLLELGGSDPYIVLRDADLKSTVETCVAARLLNTGQSCIAAKRFIVEQPVYDDFVSLFIEIMRSKKMGDPMDPTNDLGPMARVDLRDDLHRQVEESISQEAIPLLGCIVPESTGAFYPASILAGVEPGMPAFDEELFGPVAAIIKAENESKAVRLANLSPFGLGAAIFTADIERGEYLAKYEIEAGSCFVNSFVKSDPRLPFGGIKESGYGRELSAFGIHEFVNIKTVYVK